MNKFYIPSLKEVLSEDTSKSLKEEFGEEIKFSTSSITGWPKNYNKKKEFRVWEFIDKGYESKE